MKVSLFTRLPNIEMLFSICNLLLIKHGNEDMVVCYTIIQIAVYLNIHEKQ